MVSLSISDFRLLELFHLPHYLSYGPSIIGLYSLRMHFCATYRVDLLEVHTSRSSSYEQGDCNNEECCKAAEVNCSGAAECLQKVVVQSPQ